MNLYGFSLFLLGGNLTLSVLIYPRKTDKSDDIQNQASLEKALAKNKLNGKCFKICYNCQLRVPAPKKILVRFFNIAN